MLVVNNDAREILETNKVQYGEYLSPEDIFLTTALNVALENAIRYNEQSVEDAEVIAQYVNYVKEKLNIVKFLTKMEKMQLDLLTAVCDLTEGKHEEIMNFKATESEE